jgi:hypothetical protein
VRVEALITEIEVKNFKTLRDVKIPLAPGITVMVGANNSGKSNGTSRARILRGCPTGLTGPRTATAWMGLSSPSTTTGRLPRIFLARGHDFKGEGETLGRDPSGRAKLKRLLYGMEHPDRGTMREAALPIAKTFDVRALEGKSPSFAAFLTQLR